jgi:hypothetical protein
VLAILRLNRGRNVVFSSAAQRDMEIRAPWDVVNLAVMCGIDAATAKATISAHARAVLLHAEARKTMKCVLREVKLQTEPTAAVFTGAAAAPAAKQAVEGGDGSKQKAKKMKLK